MPAPSGNANTLYNRIDSNDHQRMNLYEKNAFRYVCGYYIDKCLKKHSCEICLNYANDTSISQSETVCETIFCAWKAYKVSADSPYGKLHMPKSGFVNYVEKLEKLFFDNIKNFITKEKIIYKYLELFRSILLITLVTIFLGNIFSNCMLGYDYFTQLNLLTAH